jgi:hypothetical protein
MWALLTCLGMSLTAAGCREVSGNKPVSEKNACQFPALLKYTSPGCADDVKPTCVEGAGAAGACASGPVCGCNGSVLWGVCRLNAYDQKYQFAFPGSPDAGACKLAEGYDAGPLILPEP